FEFRSRIHQVAHPQCPAVPGNAVSHMGLDEIRELFDPHCNGAQEETCVAQFVLVGGGLQDLHGFEVGRGFLARLAAKAKAVEKHTSELQSRGHLVCRLLLEKKKKKNKYIKAYKEIKQ